MGDFHMVIMAGNLRSDPQLLKDADGTAFARSMISITTNGFRDGVPFNERLFMPLDVGGIHRARTFVRRYRKGQRVVVIGRITFRDRIDDPTRKQMVIEVDNLIDAGMPGPADEEVEASPHALQPSSDHAADDAPSGIDVAALTAMLSAATVPLQRVSQTERTTDTMTDGVPDSPASLWNWDALV